MEEEKELKFVRMRDQFTDLIGWVKYEEEYIVIEHPLVVNVDSIIEEGRQILSMNEYLPQAIVTVKEIDIYNDDIMFITPVNEDFKEQYLSVADFFYNNKSKIKNKEKKKEPKESDGNVISLVEAIIEKKNKPIH
jgi:hypothetical protein